MAAKKNKSYYDRHRIIYSIIDSYLNGERNPELDVRIQDWLSNGEGHFEKERALGEVWEQTVREGRPDKGAYRSLADLRRRLGFKETTVVVRQFPLGRLLMRTVASLSIGFLVGGALFFVSQSREATPEFPLAERITVNAGDEGKVEVTLPDGSVAWVHRNGSISYYDGFESGRKIYLEGEAYFSVVKRNGEPFMVEGEDISVKVLGTEFMVQTQTDNTTSRSVVEVASGSVEVSARKKSVVLGANDRLVYEGSAGEFLLSEIPEADIAPWRNATLNFESASLEDVFRNISLIYDVEINIEGRLSAEDLITVNFPHDTPMEEVLQVVSMTSRTFDFETGNNGKSVNVSTR